MVGTALRLTATTKNQVGTAFWPTALNPATTTIEFDAALSGGTGGPSGGGDGLAFVIADATANTPSALGVNGGGLGYSGIKGLAVALDTFGGATDPADNFLGLANGWNTPNTDDLKWLATNTTVPKFRTATRHVTITIAAGRVKVKIGTTQYLDVAATLPASAYLGFSAANGDYTDNHTITNVVITNG